MGLQDQKLMIKKYLKTIGVLRNWRADLAIMRFLKPEMQTAEEITKAMEAGLVGKFREASAEVRFQGYLNRDLAILRNNGHEDLIPAVKTLKTIKFVQKQLAEAREAIGEKDGDSTPADE